MKPHGIVGSNIATPLAFGDDVPEDDIIHVGDSPSPSDDGANTDVKSKTEVKPKTEIKPKIEVGGGGGGSGGPGGSVKSVTAGVDVIHLVCIHRHIAWSELIIG